MASKKRDRRRTAPPAVEATGTSGVPLMLSMISLTLSAALYTVNVTVARTADEDVSYEPAMFAILLSWVALAALAWFVIALVGSRRARRGVSRTTRGLVLAGALGFVAAVVTAWVVEPIWAAWLVAGGASILTGGATARLKGRRLVEGLALGLVLAMAGVVVETLLPPRRAPAHKPPVH